MIRVEMPEHSRRELEQIGRLKLQSLGIVRLASSEEMMPPAQPLEPAPERTRHDPVERLDKSLRDSAGAIGRPFRVVDTLAMMQKRGSITAEMRAAGETFRDDFALGQLDSLRAADLERAGLGTASGPHGGISIGHRAELARARVWASIRLCGGIASPGGSCIWHVLGWGQSLSEWAQTQGWAGRRVSREAAGGILVAALGALVEKSA